MTRVNVSRALIGMLLFAAHAASADNPQLDRSLIDALRDKDLSAARVALEAGANPQAHLGFELSDSALCTAIDDRGTQYLELLLEYGASADFHFDDGPYALRTPLACAIDYYNPAAFDLLLARGADPDADLCSECDPRFRHTPLTQALISGKFPMALTLARISVVDDLEVDTLLMVLEDTPFDQTHPWNDERDALIAWVREQGIPIDPRPASPPLPGKTAGCVFSVRDMEEGRSEPTICE